MARNLKAPSRKSTHEGKIYRKNLKMYNLVNIQDAKLRTVILDIQNIKTKKKTPTNTIKRR